MANLLAAHQSIILERKNKSAHGGCLQPKMCISFKLDMSVNQKNKLLIWTPSILWKLWELRVHKIFENWSLIRSLYIQSFVIG